MSVVSERLSVGAVCLLLLLSTKAFAGGGHHHHHGSEPEELSLKLDNGKKWTTDQTLRTNMEKIHDYLKARIGKVKSGEIAMADYQQLGKDVGGNIELIFKNCKLPPKADAELHKVLAELIEAKTQLEGKSGLADKKKAFYQVISGYKSYVKHFDHNSR